MDTGQRRKVLGGLVAVVVGFFIFNSLSSGSDSSDTSTPVVPSVASGSDCAKDGKFCGDLKATYESAFYGCSAFTRRDLKEQLGAASTNVDDIGEAFASAYQDFAKQAAFEGCVDGILESG